MVEVTTGPAVDTLVEQVRVSLHESVNGWVDRGTVDLFDELVRIYGRAVLQWAGTGAGDHEADTVTRELAAILDGFGIGATSYPRALVGRLRAERWAWELVAAVRDGSRAAPEGSVLDVLASQPRSRLSSVSAATELVNVARPTVAIAYFAVFAAHALAEHPEWRSMLAAGDERYLRAFEHEVRRFYPFAPLLAGRLRRPMQWQGPTVPVGGWIVLDIRATNLDPEQWKRPTDFDPERFLDHEPTPFDFVPQGGGDVEAGHRCPGEPITIGVLQATLQQLAGIEYRLAPRSRNIPLSRIPSLPAHGLRLLDVRRASRMSSPQRGG
jgi:fatty-acid peroxygenase